MDARSLGEHVGRLDAAEIEALLHGRLDEGPIPLPAKLAKIEVGGSGGTARSSQARDPVRDERLS